MEHRDRNFGTRPQRWAVFLFGTLLLIGACKRPEDELGLNILSTSATLGVQEVDSTSLIAYPVLEPALRTSALSRNALGSYLDRDLGLVKASIITQVRLSTNNVGQTSDNHALVADSLVLSLVYDENSYVYGNLNPQVLRVYEIAEDLNKDSIYKNDHVPQVALLEDLVAEHRGILKPNPFTGPVVGEDTLKPQARIALKTSLAQRFLEAWGTADLADNTAFLNFFKGLWIVPENGSQLPFQQGILYFNLLDAQSKLTLYYRDASPGNEDTLSFDFLINDNCARYTHCEHDPSAAVVPYLNNALQDSTLGQQRSYVQALAGMRTEVRFPYLDKYPDARLNAIAKAELVVPVDGTFYPYYQPPAQMFVLRKGEDGEDLFLPDQLPGAGELGGIYDSDAREYRFNVTRWVQGIFNGTYANTGLSIVPTSGGVTANRVVISGPESAQNPMKLLLTFTTY